MKKFKKILAISLVLVMMLGMIPFIGAGATDVRTIYDYVDADDIERYEAVAVLTRIGVLRGDPDGRFRPRDHFTRAEAAAVIARFNLGAAITNMLPPAPTGFPDVPQAHWASRYVAFAVEQGIIVGFPDGNFRPEQNVTATQFAAMLLRSLGYGELGEFEGPAWEVNVIVQATARQAMLAGVPIPAGPILTGNADFTAPATREWVAQYALNAMRWVDVVYGTGLTVGGFLVSQAYRPLEYPPRQLMTRVHQLQDPTGTDNFARPHTEWRQGPGAGTPIGVNVPHEYLVSYTARQTATTVGILVRDNGFGLTQEGGPNFAQVWLNGQPQANISTAAALEALTANGTEVIVYANTIGISRVVVIQTDLFQVDTINVAARRVNISAVSPDPLRASYVVAHSPIALDNSHYEYLRELDDGGRRLVGGGDIVLVVPVWDAASAEFVIYSVETPELFTGALTVRNVAASTLTHGGEVYHLSRALAQSLVEGEMRSAFEQAVPHATNEVRLWVDAFGFVVDIRTVPGPPTPTHVLILETGVLIQEGTRLFTGIRGVTNLGVEVFWRVDGATPIPGRIFTATAPTAGVRTLAGPEPAQAGAHPATEGQLVQLTTGANLRSQDVTLTTANTVNNVRNLIAANVRFIYFGVNAPTADPAFGVVTGAFTTRTGREAVTGIPGFATNDINSWALVTTVGGQDIVTTIFIAGAAGIQNVDQLLFIRDNDPIRFDTTPDGTNRPVLRAWRGADAVPDGVALTENISAAQQYRFFVYEVDEYGVHRVQQIPADYVSNERIQMFNLDQGVMQIGTGAAAVLYNIAGARVIDTRRAPGPEGTNQAQINETLAGLAQAVNLADTIDNVYVSFVFDNQTNAVTRIFITNVTRILTTHADSAAVIAALEGVLAPLVDTSVVPTAATFAAAANAATGVTITAGMVALNHAPGHVLATGETLTVTITMPSPWANISASRPIP